MPAFDFFRTTIVASLAATLLTAPAAAADPSVPTVYQDDYVTVHAGIAQAGKQPVHLGDALSLVIDIVFDAQQVQIENLGDEVFQRAFAGTPAIRLYEPAVVTTRSQADSRVRITGHWRLQMLDCPDGLTSCAGSRSYELPVMTVSYQLTERAGGSSDSRSARFRPWPGTIAVTSAIAVTPKQGVELPDVLPGGAYAQPEHVAQQASASSLLLIAGALLFAMGFFVSLRQRHPGRVTVRPHHADTRWEHAILRLRDDALRDDEWSDLLRRCVTWYCVDELGKNPYAWLGAAASDAAVDDPTMPSAARDLFLDVLNHEGIAQDERSTFLDRLRDLTGQPGKPGAPEQPA